MAIKTENFDSVTAPAIPAGWFTGALLATTASYVSPLVAQSSPNALSVAAANSRRYAVWGTQDSNGGNVTVQATFATDAYGGGGGIHWALVARSNVTTINEASSTFYRARYFLNSAVWVIDKVVGGLATTLVSTSITLAASTWYRCTFNLNGTALDTSIQRLSDGKWLNSSNVFQSGQTTLNSTTDGAITGAGYAGLALQNDQSFVYSDDWVLTEFTAADNPPLIVVPDWPRRVITPSYQGYVKLPQIADRLVPGQPAFPFFATGPRRASPTVYGATGVAPPPLVPAPGQQYFPDSARRRGWTSPSGYAGQGIIQTPFPPPLLVPIQTDYPDQAPGPKRSANPNYLGLISKQQIADRDVPGTPVFPDRAPRRRRADVTAYKGTSVFSMPTVQILAVSVPPVFPDRADGPRRNARTAYEGLLSEIPYPDANPPPGTNLFLDKVFWATRRAPVSEYAALANAQPPTPPPLVVPIQTEFPDQAPGPRRTANTAYLGAISKPQIGDATPPPGQALYLDRVYFPQRTARNAYVGLISTQLPTGSLAVGTPSFTAIAAAPRRSAVTSYIVALGTTPTESRQPVGAAEFPDLAPGARRAANTVYAGAQPAMMQASLPGVPGQPVYPALAPGPRRGTADSYAGLLSKRVPSDARQPVGTIYYAQAAPGPRRAGFYTAYVSPGIADRLQPAKPVWPDLAPAARRAGAQAFLGLFSKPALGDVRPPAGTVYVAAPQRLPARGSQENYKGLFSKPLIADARMPVGRVEFPVRAPAAIRTSNSAYIRNNPRVAGERRDLSVAATFNISANVNAGTGDAGGQIFNLAVRTTFNIEAGFPRIVFPARFRSGDVVPFVFHTPEGTTLQAPILSIVNEQGVSLATYPLWTWDDGATWRYDLVLNERFPLARLTGQTELLTSTGSCFLQQSFEVVEGGDPGSSIIAVYAFDGAAGRFVLAQLRTGRLMQGGEPWI